MEKQKDKTMKKLIAGNWKMNTTREEAGRLFSDLAAASESLDFDTIDMLVCPPFTWLMMGYDYLSDVPVMVGAQDCSAEESGAYTGAISAEMIRDTRAEWVIVGHSERRHGYAHDSNQDVLEKATEAWDKGLKTIVCVGETLEERENGQAIDVVKTQIDESMPKGASPDHFVIAYEPVWAIGTGQVASIDDIKDMHEAILDHVSETHGSGEWRVLYGGSVKPNNASDILSLDSVGGVLVGGASLKAQSFVDIASAI